MEDSVKKRVERQPDERVERVERVERAGKERGGVADEHEGDTERVRVTRVGPSPFPARVGPNKRVAGRVRVRVHRREDSCSERIGRRIGRHGLPYPWFNRMPRPAALQLAEN